MNLLRTLIDNPDVGWLLVLICLLGWVGSAMVANRNDLRIWGYRSAAVAFVAYALYAIARFKPERAEEFVWVTIRAILASGVAVGLAWIVIAVLAFVIKTPLRTLQQFRTSLRQRLVDRSNRQSAEAASLERERARRQAAMWVQTDAQAEKRRAAARAQCEFLYHLHSPEIEGRFPRASFDDFVSKYLGDRHSPEDVEVHAEQLRTLIDAHMKIANPQPRLKTLQDLDNWYQNQRKQIDALPDGGLKGSLYALLEASRSELSFQLLEELSP